MRKKSFYTNVLLSLLNSRKNGQVFKTFSAVDDKTRTTTKISLGYSPIFIDVPFQDHEDVAGPLSKIYFSSIYR